MRRRCFYVLLLCLFHSFAWSGQATGLRISIDMESARSNAAVIAKKKVTDQQLDTLAGLYGNQQLIRKVKSYSGAGKDIFISTLKELITTGSIKGNDPYNWLGVKAALPEINSLIRQIDQDKAGFVNAITSMIAPYTPEGMDLDIKACFLAGGGALGFTIGNDLTFNVALQKLNGDLGGTKLLVAHELYHIVQAAGQQSQPNPSRKDPPYYLEASAALLENLWSEGTANLAGDFAGFKGSSTFAKEQTAEWKKNTERRRENFTLFEAILYKCYHDTAAKRYEHYYNVCFTMAFDETAYFAGYEMAKAIQQYQGKSALAAMVKADPVLFTDTYIKIYKENNDPRLIRFDASTEAIVAEIMRSRQP